MPEEEGAHEHLCSRCLKTYECHDPEDADLEMGLCPGCKSKPQQQQKRGGKRDGRKDPVR